MENTNYQNFKSAIAGFKDILDNISEICENRTVQYSSVGTLAGTLLGGLTASFVKSDDNGNGSLIGSLAGALLGGVLGGTIAGHKNRNEKKSCAQEIEDALSEWRRTELPIVEAFLQTYDKNASTFDLEVQYYIESSAVLNKVMFLTEEDIKNNADLLRRCVASRFRMFIDIDEGNKIINYMNSYSDYLDDLDNFKEWQSHLFSRTQWVKTYDRAYYDVCNKINGVFSIVQKNNFKKVLKYIPLLRAEGSEKTKLCKKELSLPPIDISSRSVNEAENTVIQGDGDDLSDDELLQLAGLGNSET